MTSPSYVSGLIQFEYDDGGRAAAGYRGKARDCAIRAIAIVTGRIYQEVYDGINELAKRELAGKRKRNISNARTGVYRETVDRYMQSLGYRWTPTMQIGRGCAVHLRADELPAGRLLISLSKHYAAVIHGVLHDVFDCSRQGRRCVYGYYSLNETSSSTFIERGWSKVDD